jgi:beta-lactamase regulating signal transducer with metallopeptidase domain
MTGLSQSAFLQALGWATLNSIWQIALLWCCFMGANYFFKLSAAKKYFFSVAAIISGAVWFVTTFILHYNGNFSYEMNFSQAVFSLKDLMPLVLTAASITYLLLLSVPACRLYYNWRRVQFLRKKGLTKVDISYKLFVKKIAAHLGIKKTVGIYFSEMVKSPLTIGYLKPLILLPLASINNLTVQQVEAVLLHELSHIKRFDYLVNILISIIHTVLYFNPFARLLIRVVQEERENCCDQMVLQFGYDRVGYASALLSLEKTSLQSHSFVLGAAGKRNLLSRIEKIVGIEKKIVFQFSHFMGLLAAVLCIFIFNSVLITSREKTGLSLSFNNLANPFYFFDEIESPSPLINVENHKAEGIIAEAKKEVIKIKAKTAKALSFLPENSEPAFVQPPAPELIQVAFNEAQVALSKEQAEHVKATIENTKKILSTYQWKEVEKTIGDGLTSQEKAAVKQEYLNQVKKIDWKNMETGLKAAYENINWPELDGTIKTALASVKLDSLQTKCEETLEVIDKVQAEIEASAKSTLLPFPDESMEKIQKRQAQIQTKLEEIKLIRTKKVIKL